MRTFSFLSAIAITLIGSMAEANTREVRRPASRPQMTAESLAGSVCRRGDTNTFRCMVCNVYHEARGESMAGKVAVARTVLTRVQRDYADNACRVIYARSQFSWTLSGPRRLPSRRDPINYEALSDSVNAVSQAMRQGANQATHFHTPAVRPGWRNRCRRTSRVGGHIFYNCLSAIDQDLQRNAQVADGSGGTMPELFATSGTFDPSFMVPDSSVDEPGEHRLPASTAPSGMAPASSPAAVTTDPDTGLQRGAM